MIRMTEQQHGSKNSTSKGRKSLRLFLCSQNESRESSHVDLSAQEVSMNQPYNEKFSRKLLKERERRTLERKECKINEKKKESLSLRKLTKVRSFCSLSNFLFAHILLFYNPSIFTHACLVLADPLYMHRCSFKCLSFL